MQWFYHPANEFHTWDITHLLTISIIISLYVFIYLARHTLYHYRCSIRIGVGLILLLSRISLDIWYITTGKWNISTALPLELCSIASIVYAIMLLTKNRFLFESFYFIGIAGALQAIITPELHLGFPQFRFIQFFFDHFLLILAPLIMIWLYDYTITKLSVLKALITINSIAVVVWIINSVIDANYMFLMYKPASVSLLDILGAYPYYLLSLEGITIIIFFILYLPFIKQDK